MVILGKEAYKAARKMTNEKLEPMKQTFINIAKEKQNETEKCVYCNSITPYKKSDNINIRKYYVKGAGQLCITCFFETYGEI